MLKTLASTGLIAAMALAPLLALAAAPSPALAETNSSKAYHHHHKPTGSFRSEMNRRSSMSKTHARASAEHMRQMRMRNQ